MFTFAKWIIGDDWDCDGILIVVGNSAGSSERFIISNDDNMIEKKIHLLIPISE